ncbi:MULTISPECIES: hypothetical protein [unclassified Halomonas]|uniref:Uncharacterized protein n=1 Tax=Halomonas sp. RT37 TaxID=2950872 RepID=A0AAU7KMH0_9GAMM|nr:MULTISPECIES: hypothetical protein [unclassified Halomonas]MBR9879679.1 hypothetical protein [Gammaproteobacteria bacterium]MBS8270029.1 hypothetical protein [Halomonas litopenaei]MAR70869.1 hypothetical protein [Halomonas sp.]MBY5942090.1 hypothetical protein [Halomonas sp. DP5N14-9]MCJ8286852.1 hypothetical protein [Halomonas sp.]|tara:strand:- start:791 stop:1000 length:210 start_codon:yes stop_codon:yes gene_type:complete
MSAQGQRILEQIQQQLQQSTEAAETAGWDDVDITASGTVVVRRYASKDAAELERQRIDQSFPLASHDSQ